MIEISARLTRGAIYFAGEVLECWITLRNSSAEPGEKDASAKAGVGPGETASVAFVSGQIHCQCSVEESKVVLPADFSQADLGKRRDSSTNLSDQNTFCLVSTVPKLLVGSLSLAPGEEFNVLYSETIPKSDVPSFRGGILVRYAWKLAFGCQVLGRDTTVIHIPLYILVIKDLENLLNLNDDLRMLAITEDLAENASAPKTNGSNGATKENGIHASYPAVTIEAAMEILDNLTSRKSLKTYNIESSSGKIGKLSLSKTKFRLGEDILGRFDFKDRSITCVQYLVSLISEESIKEEHRKSKNIAPTETIAGKVHDFCLCLEQTNFILPVPLHITPSFSSDIMELKWKLRLEFALSGEILQLDVPAVGQAEQSVLWRPPLRVPVETLVWDVPVEIFPTDPIQVQSAHLRDSLGSDVRVRL
ncbi:LOW QUALITY PROTEIN: RAB6A-GEF complex partner protein 2-like [Paramacrobiotus metropolitanus]|uniref:LOW QUALITY PROTEIN: RAB6A-GEF complex partner protein 2-like n=1 Tax=Paramacrobiotus metropolitanus TaxID=2943436 RepID=UPI0024457A25|nr:LOW QUALITY PROTEIN: RAB6A-GEF complex partner protein 2-like [Paramacrobiotus metropolitanus]